MEGAGLLGHPPSLQNYLNVCHPPLFGAPWLYQRQMQLSEFQYGHPPVFPFGMQSLTSKKRRRRRNMLRTSWTGNPNGHKNLEIQIKLGNNFNFQPTINVEVGTHQIANIVVKSTGNSQEQNSRQRIRKHREATSVNLSLEAKVPNRSKFNAAQRRRNRSQQWSKMKKNLIEGTTRQYGIPFKSGTSPLLRDERLNIPKTSQLNRTRRCRRRRRNFQNRQINGGNDQQHQGMQVEVTEIDGEGLELVDEVAETDEDDLEDSAGAPFFCADGTIEH